MDCAHSLQLFIGICFFLWSTHLLITNENQNEIIYWTTKKGSEIVQSVPSTPIIKSNDGKLVHITGRVIPTENTIISDDTLSVVLPEVMDGESVIKIRRNVEMYQWFESEERRRRRRRLDNDDCSRVTYGHKWSSTVINSNYFCNPFCGHTNPDRMPINTTTIVGAPIVVGTFHLSHELVDEMNWYKSFKIPSNFNVSNIKPITLSNGNMYKATMYHNRIYFGHHPKRPTVGDIRISFGYITSGNVTIISEQVGDSLIPYILNRTGADISIIRRGTLSTKEMFGEEAREEKREENIWWHRFIAVFIMYFGLTMVFQGLNVFSDDPEILCCYSLKLTLVLSMVLIAISWTRYNPFLSSCLFCVVVIGYLRYFSPWVRVSYESL